MAKPEGLTVVQKNLYVGCSLTQASEGFKADVERTKAELGKRWHVMEFLGLVDGDEFDVYQRDIVENVGGCDAFVAICDEPSIGLGWELREAVGLGKPTLAVAHEDAKITRLLLGATGFNDNLTFRRYEDMVHDVPAIVAEEFAVVLNGAAQAITPAYALPEGYD